MEYYSQQTISQTKPLTSTGLGGRNLALQQSILSKQKNDQQGLAGRIARCFGKIESVIGILSETVPSLVTCTMELMEENKQQDLLIKDLKEQLMPKLTELSHPEQSTTSQNTQRQKEVLIEQEIKNPQEQQNSSSLSVVSNHTLNKQIAQAKQAPTFNFFSMKGFIDVNKKKTVTPNLSQEGNNISEAFKQNNPPSDAYESYFDINDAEERSLLIDGQSNLPQKFKDVRAPLSSKEDLDMKPIDPVQPKIESKKRPYPDSENRDPNEPLIVEENAKTVGNKRGKKKNFLPLLSQSQIWLSKKDDQPIPIRENSKEPERQTNKRPMYEKKYTRQSKNQPNSGSQTEQNVLTPSSIQHDDDVYVALDCVDENKQVTPAPHDESFFKLGGSFNYGKFEQIQSLPPLRDEQQEMLLAYGSSLLNKSERIDLCNLTREDGEKGVGDLEMLVQQTTSSQDVSQEQIEGGDVEINLGTRDRSSSSNRQNLSKASEPTSKTTKGYYKPQLQTKEKSSGKYLYREVVRDKDQRRAMKGFACFRCESFYKALGCEDDKKLQSLCNDCSRHRDNNPILSPRKYYDLDL
ncbi:hypothetical protein FGO68_gene13780 [Halteria grandinella]|uniref:Uncharacterized protein n=1 Tax=Halteria grandinella TaxID=5974 RepID=A0A8J8NSW4_HALGN|nr:hypothetical protein FGO68_gene13780 [Halteria grandinella]